MHNIEVKYHANCLCNFYRKLKTTKKKKIIMKILFGPLTSPTRQQVLQLMMTRLVVETCTVPCGLNLSNKAPSTAADDD